MSLEWFWKLSPVLSMLMVNTKIEAILYSFFEFGMVLDLGRNVGMSKVGMFCFKDGITNIMDHCTNSM